MEKKSSDHFRDILNPYGEKPNYGKIGRRRRLSKLNVFFHNSVGYHNVVNPIRNPPQLVVNLIAFTPVWSKRTPKSLVIGTG